MPMPETFSFFSPLKINCGSHALTHLPYELAVHGARAPLILASREIIGRNGVDTVVDAFRSAGLTLGVYDRMPGKPSPDMIPFLAGLFRDSVCDSLVAVGSDAVVDMAKCLNLSLSARDANKDDPAGRLRPLFLVATPGGNGNEATGYAYDGERHFSSADLIPSTVIIDPEMMVAVSDRDMVNAALLALTHAIEAFCDDAVGPAGRAYAHAAIGLVMNSLLAALRSRSRHRQHLQALVNGQVAAGCAFFAAPPGICHLLASRLKETTDLPIGILMVMLLPHMVEAAADVQPERASDLLYPMAGGSIFAVTAEELKGPRIIALIWEFLEALNAELPFPIPASLVDAGITEEQVDRVLSRPDGLAGEEAVRRIIAGARKGITLMAE